MDRRTRSQKYHNKNLKHVMGEIAQRNGLLFDESKDEFGVTFDDDFSLTQTWQTDAKFMEEIAKKYGLHWGVDKHSRLFLIPPIPDFPDSATGASRRKKTEKIILNYRIGDRSLKSFSPKIKDRMGSGSKTSRVDSIPKFQGISTETGQAFTHEELKAAQEIILARDPTRGTGGFSPHEVTKIDLAITAASERARKSRELSGAFAGRTDFRANGQEFTLVNFDDPTNKKLGETHIVKIEERVTSAAKQGVIELFSGLKSAKKADAILATAVPTIGSTLMNPPNIVDIFGTGTKFSGPYRIVEGDHTLGRNGYSCKIGLGKRGKGKRGESEITRRQRVAFTEKDISKTNELALQQSLTDKNLQSIGVKDVIEVDTGSQLLEEEV